MLVPVVVSASNLSECRLEATFVAYKAVKRGEPMTFVVDVQSATKIGTDPKVCKGLKKKGLVIRTRDRSFVGVSMAKGDEIVLSFLSVDDNRTGKTNTSWTFVSKKEKKSKK